MPHPRRAPVRRVGRILLSLVVVVAVFAFALPKVAGSAEVWARIAAMSWPLLILLGLAAAWNLVTYAFVLTAATPGLTYPQAIVVTESATAVANAVPGGGALGVGVTAAMYRSWGFDRSTTGIAIVITGIWNNLVKLGLPLLALTFLAVQGDAGTARLTASVAGACALAAATVGIIVVLRSDTGARRAGAFAERVASCARRIMRRPRVTGWGDSASQLRGRARDIVRESWGRLTLATVVSQLSLYLVLLLALRGVGISGSSIGWAEVLAAFTFVRLLSALPLTPGGVGVVELGLTGALVAAGGDRGRVVAAVLVFRALTYLAPIALGAVTYVVWRRRTAWRTPNLAVA